LFPLHIVDGSGWTLARRTTAGRRYGRFRGESEEVGGGEGTGALEGLHLISVVEWAVLEFAEVGVLEDVIGGEIVLPQEECLMDRERGVVFIVGLGGGLNKPIGISGIVSGKDLCLMLIDPGGSWRGRFDGSLFNGVRGWGERRCRTEEPVIRVDEVEG
jgi:hypothetical protein